MELRDLLKENMLIEGMNDRQVDVLMKAAVYKEYKSGDILISETNRSRDIFIIAKGSVSVQMCVPTDDEQSEVIDHLHSGKLIGEIAFIDGSPRSATVTAVEKTGVYWFKYDAINKIIDEDKEFAYLLMRGMARTLSAKVRQTNLAWRNLVMW